VFAPGLKRCGTMNTKLEFTQPPRRAFPVQREFYDVDYLAGIGTHF
jgi:hypothetical protein